MKKCLYILTVLAGTSIYSQQDILISQVNFNHGLFNPGAVGTAKYANIITSLRSQWVGYTGSPVSGYLDVKGPIDRINSGIGLLMTHDQIGVSLRSDVYATYAYKLKLNKSSSLSLGLRGGFSFIKVTNSQHVYWDDGDQLLTSDISRVQPNVGFGLYYKWKDLRIGAAVPGVINYRPESSLSANGLFQLERHYYFNVAYKFKTGENFTVEPSAFSRYVLNAPFQIDANIMCRYKEFFGLGLGYRSGDAIVLSTLFQVSQRFRFGYAYDITYTAMRNFSSGSHELVMFFNLSSKKHIAVPSFYDYVPKSKKQED